MDSVFSLKKRTWGSIVLVEHTFEFYSDTEVWIVNLGTGANISLSLPLSLSPSLPHSLSPSLPHCLSPSLPLSHSLSLSLPLSLSHSLYPPLSLTLSLTLSLSLILSLSHSHSLIYSLSLSLSLPLSLYLSFLQGVIQICEMYVLYVYPLLSKTVAEFGQRYKQVMFCEVWSRKGGVKVNYVTDL